MADWLKFRAELCCLIGVVCTHLLMHHFKTTNETMKFLSALGYLEFSSEC